MQKATRDTSVLAQIARDVRVDILKMTFKAQSGHPGGSMSAAELLTALYFGERKTTAGKPYMTVDPANPKWDGRDRFILSKGHCCPVQYAVLARRGFFDRKEFTGLRRAGNLLQGHSDIKVPGVDMSSGSLGMGLGFANGVALGARVQGKGYHTWVMMGDGEIQEGNVWESAMSAAHRKLDNVTAILDYNKIQIDGFVKDVKNLEPVTDKWRAFGWHVIEIDGHNYDQIFRAYDEALATKGKPTIVVAHTLKGKGVSFTENKADYHGRALTAEEMKRAMAELGENWEVA